MTIVVTGAGSGGHITPVLAVAEQLKQLNPNVRVVYIGQTGDNLGDTVVGHPAIDEVRTIQAGKFRRYHGEGIRQLLDFKTMWLNIRDAFRVVVGLVQAFVVLRRERPAVVFIKGGYVGVPVGLASAVLRIPYVTHDSDAIPGLANRIIARWARYHAVALQREQYQYPRHKTVSVGVPVSNTFRLVEGSNQAAFKRSLSLDPDAPVLLVTGGGLGARRINDALLAVIRDLLAAVPNLQIIHTVGRANEELVRAAYDAALDTGQQGRVRVLGYTTDLYRYSGAADLIISRAGATAIAEFAVQGKAVLLVPSPFLAGGHQLKNAEALQKKQAVAVLDESSLATDLPLVLTTISSLLSDESARHTIAKNLHAMAHPHAAKELAELILKASANEQKTSEA